MTQVQDPQDLAEASPPASEWQAVQDSPVWTPCSVWTRYHVDVGWLAVYIVANALVFWLRFREYEIDPCVSLGPAVAKGSAEVVVFNCVLTLLSVCHRVVDKLRGLATASCSRLDCLVQRPVEMHRECHILTGSVVLVMSLVHSVCWGLILHWCQTCDERDWQRSQMATAPPTRRLRESARLHALPMWTGLAMGLGALVLLPFCVGRVRRKWFPMFERVHRAVLVPFLLLLLFHGAAQWTSRLQAPLWLVPVLVVYAAERHSRLSQRASSTILCFDTTHAGSSKTTGTNTTVIRMFLLKTERFHRCFEPGMFVYLQVPAVSSLEWHPFSVCSSGEDSLVELHIRVVGDWTRQLLALLEHATPLANDLGNSLTPVAIPVRMDGPFGTPTVQVFRYESVLLVALGVGVAPFLSVLRHQLHAWRRAQRQHPTPTPPPTVQSLSLLWVVRDLELVEWLAETLREFDDVVDRMGRDALDLHVVVTTDRHVDTPMPALAHWKIGSGRPHWPRVLDEWTAECPPQRTRRAVFVSGSHAATSAIKHAAARGPRVDVYAERFH